MFGYAAIWGIQPSSLSLAKRILIPKALPCSLVASRTNFAISRAANVAALVSPPVEIFCTFRAESVRAKEEKSERQNQRFVHREPACWVVRNTNKSITDDLSDGRNRYITSVTKPVFFGWEEQSYPTLEYCALLDEYIP